MPISKVDKLVAVAEEIFGDENLRDTRYLHAMFAQCGLPYREVPEPVNSYKKTNGGVTLILYRSHAFDPRTNELVLQRIPFGVKPRVLLLHLCTLATKQKTNVLEIPPSMSGLMRDLGIGVTGGRTGSVTGFKEQLQRLAATRMSVFIRYKESVAMENSAPTISRFEVWFPDENAKSKMLWPSTVTLSNEFYESLQNGNALPVDARAIRVLQHSAMSLDVYTWLAHRLCRVSANRPQKVGWEALRTQFGPEFNDMRKFRQSFLSSLKDVQAVYPAANVTVDSSNPIELRFSHPPIRRKAVAVTGNLELNG